MADSVLKLTCGCPSPFQDSKYGQGVRIHNRGKDNTAVCTGCGARRSIPGGSK